MRILIYGQRLKEENLPYIRELFEALQKEKSEVYIFAPYLQRLRKRMDIPVDFEEFQGYDDFGTKKVDIVISMGGDGTILSSVTLVRDQLIPIMGINLGRLGFLASIEKKFISKAISELYQGMYHIEDRTMIYLDTHEELFEKAPFALNDFTLHKRDTSAMITIHTYINGDFLTSYWADGLILSTPTGSTAYSLSCGGPIIFPNSGNFVITPVAPHNLNVRPIVISDTSVVSFEIEGRLANFLCTLDSRFETVTSQQQLSVRKCEFPTRLVQLNNFSFLRTIQEKLTWGKDVRN